MYHVVHEGSHHITAGRRPGLATRGFTLHYERILDHLTIYEFFYIDIDEYVFM